MKNLLHTDSLMLFESAQPSTDEIIEVFEFYASDQLAKLGIDITNIKMARATLDGDGTMTIDYDIDGVIYTVTSVEWVEADGVAVPLVELYRQEQD